MIVIIAGRCIEKDNPAENPCISADGEAIFGLAIHIIDSPYPALYIASAGMAISIPSDGRQVQVRELTVVRKPVLNQNAIR